MKENPYTEWVCKVCYDTECHYNVNANLQIIHPDTCPLCNRLANPQPQWTPYPSEQRDNDLRMEELNKFLNKLQDYIDEFSFSTDHPYGGCEQNVSVEHMEKWFMEELRKSVGHDACQKQLKSEMWKYRCNYFDGGS